MRKLFAVTVLTALVSSSLFAQEKQAAVKTNTTVKLDLAKIQYPLEKVFISYYNSSTKVRFTDSAVLLQQPNGTVSFRFQLDEPLLAQLRVVPDRKGDTSRKSRMVNARDVYSIYLEPGTITVAANDSLSNSTVTGSPSHTEYLYLKKQLAAYDAANSALYAQYSEARKNKDKAASDRIEKSIDSLDLVIKENVYRSYLQTRGKNSPVGLYALSQYAGYAIDPVKTEPLFLQLTKKIQVLPSAKILKERIDLAKKTEVGQYAIPFTQKDTAGVDVSLASFKGKYVLLDFWASWCGPCRVENPNVVAAFQKYKDKGFTVLGISLDQPGAKEKWLKAIYDDQLTWTHVSDLKFWNNEVAKQYGILAIPQNYLLDKDGKIIGKNLRGEELQETLKTIFETITAGTN